MEPNGTGVRAQIRRIKSEHTLQVLRLEAIGDGQQAVSAGPSARQPREAHQVGDCLRHTGLGLRPETRAGSEQGITFLMVVGG